MAIDGRRVAGCSELVEDNVLLNPPRDIDWRTTGGRHSCLPVNYYEASSNISREYSPSCCRIETNGIQNLKRAEASTGECWALV